MAGLAGGLSVGVEIAEYVMSHRVKSFHFPLDSNPEGLWQTTEAAWRPVVHLTEDEQKSGFGVEASVVRGTSRPCSLGITLTDTNWSRSVYLLMPGAVYCGNRFPAMRGHDFRSCDVAAADMPVVITNVPRLEFGEGPSRIQLRSGDMASPLVAWWNPDLQMAHLLRSGQGFGGVDHCFAVEEAIDRSSAKVSIRTPGVRESVLYGGGVSMDRGLRVHKGGHIAIKVELHSFSAMTLADFFRCVVGAMGHDLLPSNRVEHIPLSAAWNIEVEKQNRQNWVEDDGYYSVGMRECIAQDWQTAWVGGLNTAYALLADGDEQTRQRATRTFDFLTQGGISPSGYFYTLYGEKEWRETSHLLTRYQGDALYFLAKSLILLESRHAGIKPAWRKALAGCARAFAATWRGYGQLGHRVCALSGEVLFGGTASAACAPGGLALAARFLGEPQLLDVALDAAEHFRRHHVAEGLTNGGPGDIIQCPDSESAFGLLESFTTLYEETSDPAWLDAAEEVAAQCATWVMPYDYRFPPESTFAKLAMATTGTVFANVQNKHSAPGICTLSGCSLLKLFRSTGTLSWLRLMESIVHAIPQYMSREDRPITDRRPGQRWPVLAPGWINERVNTSDWEVRGDPNREIGVGEVFGGSTWSEAAMMLSIAEVPGVYWQPDTGIFSVPDHLSASLETKGTADVLVLRNPTPFDAATKVLVETSEHASRHALGPNPLSDIARFKVPAHGTASLRADELMVS